MTARRTTKRSPGRDRKSCRRPVTGRSTIRATLEWGPHPPLFLAGESRPRTRSRLPTSVGPTREDSSHLAKLPRRVSNAEPRWASAIDVPGGYRLRQKRGPIARTLPRRPDVEGLDIGSPRTSSKHHHSVGVETKLRQPFQTYQLGSRNENTFGSKSSQTSATLANPDLHSSCPQSLPASGDWNGEPRLVKPLAVKALIHAVSTHENPRRSLRPGSP